MFFADPVLWAVTDGEFPSASRLLSFDWPRESSFPSVRVTGSTELHRTSDPEALHQFEAVAWADDNQFWAAIEVRPPKILWCDTGGACRDRDVPLPAWFSAARGNKGIEGLAFHPKTGVLVAALEEPLALDPKTGVPVAALEEPLNANREVRLETFVRFAAFEMRPSGDFLLSAEYRYPIKGWPAKGVGISELLFIDEQQLLVLERGYFEDCGRNTIQLYAVRLDGNTPNDELEKNLVLELSEYASELPDLESKAEARWAGKLQKRLENFEGLAWGPTLPDNGGKSLLLISDDNYKRGSSLDQVTALLMLRWSALWPPRRNTVVRNHGCG